MNLRAQLLTLLATELGTIQLPNSTLKQLALWVGEPPFNSEIIGLECNLILFPSSRSKMNLTYQVQSFSLIQHSGVSIKSPSLPAVSPKIEIARAKILHAFGGSITSAFLPATTMPDGKKSLDTVKFYVNEVLYCPPIMISTLVA